MNLIGPSRMCTSDAANRSAWSTSDSIRASNSRPIFSALAMWREAVEWSMPTAAAVSIAVSPITVLQK
jgi:hypothetical protein